MEVDQIHYHEFQRCSNGYREFASAKLVEGEKMNDQHHEDDEDEGENKRSTANNDIGGVDLGGGVGRLYGWPSSRIVRVSRASGGKDRHSKVLTSKGLRDRRVRLSVNTAIQFYDLQDRLGYDQPSKAVEWLLTAAASAIEELPPMNTSFLESTHRLSNERVSSSGGGYQLSFGSAEVGGDGNSGHFQHEAAAKSSPGSSNSENSKGSGTSISRSESRRKARERAKERAVEKEKENDSSSYVTSFTELLSGRNNCINGGGPDYFTSGLFGPPAKQPAPQFSATADHHHHPELQSFSFASNSLVSAVNSPGFSAINRGTLQSNSPSPPSLLPIFPPPQSFFSGAAPMDNHHHFLTGFDARLQLHYGRNSDQKKEKH